MAVKKPKKAVVKEGKKQHERSKSGLRVNYLIIILSGLVFLIGGILVFLMIIKNVYGNYELEEILPTKENLEKFSYKEKAAVLYSKYTENMFEPGNTWLSDNIDAWERFIKGIKMDYDIITDQDIELGKHFNYKLLMLPGAKSLSDKEIIQIKKYLDKGGSVFASGGIASFSDEAKWRGWEFFTEVFGLSFTDEIEPDDFKTKIHTLRGNLPITAGIPTGYTLQIATWDKPIEAEVLDPRVTQISFWYDYQKQAGLVMEEIKKTAGIVSGTYGRGRFIWYGFELTSVIGKQEDYVNFGKLFTNSVNWLTYNPTSFVKDWPANYDAAAILIPTIGREPENILNLSKIKDLYQFKPEIFVDPLTTSNTRVIRGATKYGSVNAIADVGFIESSIDTINNLYDQETQNSAMAFAKDTLQKIIGTDVKGFMPLNGFYNENTLQAMLKNNYTFLVTDSLTDRAVPKLEIRDDKPLLVITKTARDDKVIIGEYGLTNTKFQKYTYEEDMHRILFEGGLYVMKLHTDYQLKSEYVGVVNSVIDSLKANKVWLTTVPELMSWWMRRGGLEIRYETRSKRRIVVEVNNPKDKDIEFFVVQVNLNKKVKNIEISSDIINTEIPDFEFDDRANVLYLYVENLEEGETREFLIDFENVVEN